MVLMQTPEVKQGWHAQDFLLQGTDGHMYGLEDVRGEKGLVVMFISNHCPYVQAIRPRLVQDMKEVQQEGVGVVAIASNDVRQYPEDGMDRMQEVVKEYGFTFPYLLDETQEVARAYDAVCTPDFYGFNADLALQYRGRLDAAGANPDGGGERDLYHAMCEIAQTAVGPKQQHPSVGCSIKWK